MKQNRRHIPPLRLSESERLKIRSTEAWSPVTLLKALECSARTGRVVAMGPELAGKLATFHKFIVRSIESYDREVVRLRDRIKRLEEVAFIRSLNGGRPIQSFRMPGTATHVRNRS